MALRPGLPKHCEHSFCDSVCEAMSGTREFEVTCLACPLQISGHIDGVPFYFRARHNRWRLETGSREPDGELVAAGDTDDFTVGQAVDLIEREMSAWIWPKP